VSSDIAPWQRRSSEVVLSTPWFQVHDDDVVLPDGSPGRYHHIVTRGSVTVLAIDDADQVVMTRQWVYTHGSTQWRLPGGGIDDGDTDPLEAARRELEEETGLRAGQWESLGRINCADSMTNHVDHLFLATELVPGTQRLEPGESDLEVVRIPFESAVARTLRNELPHAGSAHAVLRAAARRVGTEC
jgi:8-oxo-dGTP pyrophosphatase MutT (NUDIX family)